MLSKLTREELLRFMREAAYKPLTFEELAEVFALSAEEGEYLRRLLAEMEAQGDIVRTRLGRYGVPERMNLVVGTLQGHEKGFGFVLPDREEFEDMFISPDDMNGAMHGDRVIARPLTSRRSPRRDRRWEGEIIRILQRANKTLVGTLEAGKHYGFVTPTDRHIFHDIFVPREAYGGARSGELVLVEIVQWPKKRRNPQGRVIQRLGRRGQPGVDILGIIHKYRLPTEFPPEVLREVREIPQEVQPADLEGRLDLRELPMITIDPPDARDFDDAVSLEREPERGLWRLGVHIADVSHYVREGTALDREARERGTSVYLVDRVIPMLPEALSNGICSLKPQVDRLALSVFMDFNDAGELLSHRIVPSVIRSKARLTYQQVFRILTEHDPELVRRFEPLVPMIEEMNRLRAILRRRRTARGAIDFEFPEARVILDEQGNPVDIVPEPHDIAHQLIEEFMIAANETVAEHYFWLQVPFLYRVHEEPAEDKIEEFARFIRAFGLRLKLTRERLHPRVLQQVLRQVEGRPEEQLISMVLLRSLQLARYSTENLGHFGLAAQYYTHFTSPIRRYPDLVIHRIVKEHLAQGQLSARRTGQLLRDLPEIAAHASERERVAEEAERETVDLKKVQYMLRHLGEVFDGVISGVTNFGFFVQLPNTVEGLVHVSTLTDDYYHFHEEQYALVGERNRRRFRIGDRVRVRVVRVNAEEGTIDFQLVKG